MHGHPRITVVEGSREMAVLQTYLRTRGYESAVTGAWREEMVAPGKEKGAGGVLLMWQKEGGRRKGGCGG